MYRILLISFVLLFYSQTLDAQILPRDAFDRHSVTVTRSGGENKIYQAGYKLDRRQVKELFELDHEAYRTIRRAYTYRAFGRTVMGIGGVIMSVGLAAEIDDGNNMWALAIVGAGIAASGIPLIKAYNKRSAAAAELYNRAVFRSTCSHIRLQLNIEPTANGIGLILRF